MANWYWLKPGDWQPEGELKKRYLLNRRYMLSLEPERLLLHHEMLAGLVRKSAVDPLDYGGWESACCQLKGHFVGHYLSACAMAWAYHADSALLGVGEEIVHRLHQCQQENRDGWCFSVPETYLEWLERGKAVWAPQYTIHKTLMGLLDMATLADSQEALEVLRNVSEWFLQWIQHKTREDMDRVLDVETGGMLEAWVTLYELTGDQRLLRLIDAYRRPRVFDGILQGRDMLTMMHANTTIPEALGYAKAYEVLGDPRDLETVKRYWACAVDERGCFATGGQTYNEVWTPPHKQADYLGTDNQEHCVVYNMLRLADFLWRHTGEARYLDYMERNFSNGIMAQQHEETGMVAYYLPMCSDAHAKWGTETQDFWCCHGTLVQIQNCEGRYMLYQHDNVLLVAQYREGICHFSKNGVNGNLRLRADLIRSHYAPTAEHSGCNFEQHDGKNFILEIAMETKVEFDLALRVPDWIEPGATITVDDELVWSGDRGEIVHLKRAWQEQRVRLHFPMKVRVEALPDQEERGAFLLGDDVLVGLTGRDVLTLDATTAAKQMRRANAGSMACEGDRYRLCDGGRSIEFIPLKHLRDENYTMFFEFCRESGKDLSV